jgi:hypothetical protein
MYKRRHFKQLDPLDTRLSAEAERLRKEARGIPPGVERDRLFAGRGLRKPPPT